jgi:curved DNA-binding protein CbpA
MTLYEELGVPPDAPPDTIHEAYRNVARLLHPDSQTNPVLKESAEVQMKRINHLYGILSDPDRRRRYDQERAGPQDRSGPIIIQSLSPATHFRRGNQGAYAWLAATAICAMAIIWLATRESPMPVVYPQPSPLRKAAEAILPKSAADRQREQEISRLRAELAAVAADRDRLLKQLTPTDTQHRFQPPPPHPVPKPQAPVAAPLTAISPAVAPLNLGLPASLLPVPPPPPKPRWSGAWAYVHERTESKNRTLFPPEFIETAMSEDHGHIRGQYHARFKVADPKISPDVDFRFEGNVTGNSGRGRWFAVDGAKGELQLRLTSDSTLEVVWTASDLGRTMGLASGTAELRRKN